MDAAIELSGLYKHFGSTQAVNGVSFSVPRGSIYGLIGPNGAGKTTTFSILAGFLRPSAGLARVLGHSPHEVARLKGRVGVLPQDAVLPTTETVGQFLHYLARLQGLDSATAESSARQCLARVGGAEWWNTRCGGLSHGMAKRVGIAQALLGNPELVLLDEPTAGLDPRVAYEVRQLIKSLGGSCTVVVSSHNLPELQEVCDAAALLDRGRLVVAASMAELTATGQVIQVQLGEGPVPLEGVRALPLVASAEFDASRRLLVVGFDPTRTEAETVIGAVLRLLLEQNARIAGVSKGRSLEQRVIELT
jgi:ABC-type multidrug transport system ATPase subunit